MSETASMLSTYVHDLSPFIFRFGETGWGLRWYGFSYLLAFLVGFWLYRQLVKKGFSDLPLEKVGDFIFGGAIFGVVLGGRLGYQLFYNFEGFLRDPLVFFRFHEGGMSAHGGIIGLALYSLWFAHRHKVSWLNLGDNLVVVAPVGLFFGRMANFINGELYGRATQVAWAVQFPKELYSASFADQERAMLAANRINAEWISLDAVIDNVRNSPELREQLTSILTPRHPSQLYEAFLEGALLFAILWIVRTKCRIHDGLLTAFFFIGYAVFRSFCELFREPDAPLTSELTRGQFLSIFLVLIGVGFAWFSRRTRVRGPVG